MDAILAMLNAEAFVSRGIKWGSVLRLGPLWLSSAAFVGCALPIVALAWAAAFCVFFGALAVALLLGVAGGLAAATAITAAGTARTDTRGPSPLALARPVQPR